MNPSAHAPPRSPRSAASPSTSRPSGSSSSTSSTSSARRSSCTASPRSRPGPSSRSTGCSARAATPTRRSTRVSRLAADEERRREAELGLHFDLTVPFARYVLENAGQLAFPFRRYQIQKVWRGERPQEGRYREFTQADIDVVDVGELSPHFEAEMPLVIAEVFQQAAGRASSVIQVNNRKIPEGFYLGIGIDRRRRHPAHRRQARQDRPRARSGRCSSRRARPPSRPTSAWRWPRSAPTDLAFVEQVRALGVQHPTLDEGLEALSRRHPGRHGARARRARRRPADRPRPRLLHRHRLRDPARRATSRGARSAPAAATTRWPPTGAPPTRVSASRSASPACWACSRASGLLTASRSTPAVRARRRQRRGGRAERPPRVATALRARGIACEVAPSRRSSASRSGTPSGAASRTSGSRVRGRAATRSRTSAPATRSTPTPASWESAGGGPASRRSCARGSSPARETGQD